jgi:hypothetical protein
MYHTITPIHLRVIEPPGENSRVSIHDSLAEYNKDSIRLLAYFYLFFNILASDGLKFQVFILYIVLLFAACFDFVKLKKDK